MSQGTPGFESALAVISAALGEGGYIALSPNVAIGGVPLEVPNAYVGPDGSLDLAIILDATDSSQRAEDRNFWMAERVARALDAAGSRRPLTLILVTLGTWRRSPTHSLLNLGRVVPVDDASRVRELLAPVMPVLLEPLSGIDLDPLEKIAEFKTSSTSDADAVARMISGARTSDNVQSRLAQWLDSAFEDRKH